MPSHSNKGKQIVVFALSWHAQKTKFWSSRYHEVLTWGCLDWQFWKTENLNKWIELDIPCFGNVVDSCRPAADATEWVRGWERSRGGVGGLIIDITDKNVWRRRSEGRVVLSLFVHVQFRAIVIFMFDSCLILIRCGCNHLFSALTVFFNDSKISVELKIFYFLISSVLSPLRWWWGWFCCGVWWISQDSFNGRTRCPWQHF